MAKWVYSVMWPLPKSGQTGSSMNVLPKDKFKVQAENKADAILMVKLFTNAALCPQSMPRSVMMNTAWASESSTTGLITLVERALIKAPLR